MYIKKILIEEKKYLFCKNDMIIDVNNYKYETKIDNDEVEN